MRKLLPLFLLTALLAAADSASPERLLEVPDSLQNPKQLPLAKGRTSSVFRGEKGTSGFNLHSYLAFHDGQFFAMWSSATVGEEDPDQHLRYATSRDGHTWSKSETLAADPDGAAGPQRWIARGFVTSGGKLHALGALVRSADYGKRGKGVVWEGLQLMRLTWDGKKWNASGMFADDCMNNFAPIQVSGVWYMPCRDRNMSLFVAASKTMKDPWRRIQIDETQPFHRLDEPTIYKAGDGTLHMVIRDGANSHKLVRSVSRDGGKTWSKPVHTNYPDATSKNFTGRLSNGMYILINNPDAKSRDPLAITTSRDGWVFGNPLAVAKDAPERRFAGRAKGSRSIQYPHAMEHGGSLWVIYATNKEDIEVTEIRLSDLAAGARQ